VVTISSLNVYDMSVVKIGLHSKNKLITTIEENTYLFSGFIRKV
jgi:hypothetical protein